MPALQTSNANVARAVEAAGAAGTAFDTPGAAWLHGLATGLGLGSRAPLTARAMRAEIERLNAEAIGISPEQVEVVLRGLIDVFDTSLDERA